MTSTLKIIEAHTPQALRQAEAIRHRVFTVEQQIAAQLVRDGLDAASIHALAFLGGQPAATGRLTLSPGGEGTMARIAVLPAYRGQGLGQRIVQFLEIVARREGLAYVSLHAHEYLEAFYARLGYETLPEQTQAGPYRLITMTKTL